MSSRIAKKTEFRERAAALVGDWKKDVALGRLRFWQLGDAHCVSIDWRQVLEREERYGDIIGFFHTHSPGMLNPSTQDDRTMEAWFVCFAKPLLCVIASGDRLGSWEYSANMGFERVRMATTASCRRRWIVVSRR